jgi:transporter family-2 protein
MPDASRSRLTPVRAGSDKTCSPRRGLAARVGLNAALARAPWWAWAGGVLGAFYVSAVTHVAPKVRVAVTLGLTVAGTMFASIALDAVGGLGLAVRPVTGGRVLGAALLVLGVSLVRR